MLLFGHVHTIELIFQAHKLRELHAGRGKEETERYSADSALGVDG